MQSKPADVTPLKHQKSTKMCMDTCTNVPDMCRKRKVQRGKRREGRCYPGACEQKHKPTSVHMELFTVEDTAATGRHCGTADHLHPPLKCVFTLGSEIVDVGLEMQLEDIVLVDVFRFRGDGH